MKMTTYYDLFIKCPVTHTHYGSNCEVMKMATDYDLFIKCPATHTHYGSNFPSQWYHAGCGAKMQIGDDARLRCTNGHSNHVRNWRYVCPEHENTYLASSAAEFANAISLAKQITSRAETSWLLRLLDNMGADW
jgi:hypothetical protein